MRRQKLDMPQRDASHHARLFAFLPADLSLRYHRASRQPSDLIFAVLLPRRTRVLHVDEVQPPTEKYQCEYGYSGVDLHGAIHTGATAAATAPTAASNATG